MFLIRDFAQLSWGQAWPMFVMLLGFGMLASSFGFGRRQWAGSWWLVWPVAWIVVGFILLMSTTGRLGVEPGDLIARWWPLIPIGIGVWFLVASIWPGRATPVESLSIPLDGVPEASVRIRFGAGQMSLGRAAAGMLVSGTCSGGVHLIRRGPGVVELEPDLNGGWPGWDRPYAWQVDVTGEVPLDLWVESGAARAVLDLGDLQLRRLDLRSGASETTLRLPRAAGMTVVKAETGAASLTVEVPAGVAARIRSRMALGTTQVNEARFPRTADGFASPDYATAGNRVELDLQGGVGAIKVV
jgi:hypothetical protein